MTFEKCIKHQERMELAGVSRPMPDLGPAVILHTVQRDDTDTWEVLPQWIADLSISDMHNCTNVRSATVYHRIPAHAPDKITTEWLSHYLHAQYTYASTLLSIRNKSHTQEVIQ